MQTKTPLSFSLASSLPRNKNHRARQHPSLPLSLSLSLSFFLSLRLSCFGDMQTSSSMELELFREEDNKQHQHGAVLKRKRTKRPRHHHHPPAASSSASSSESTTTEEEDMAHCLILLAQGQGAAIDVESRPAATSLVPPVQVQPREAQQQQSPPAAAPAPAPAVVKTERYTSRKYTEAATTADGVRAGFYVYECKTCNKCFPTFQALGGHRASHKKPRLAGTEEAEHANVASVAVAKSKPPCMKTASPPPMTTASPPPPPLPQVDAAVPTPEVTTVLSLNNGAAGSGGSNKLRVHECSICGAEFASGQALGGHMRRHRPLHAPERAVTASTAGTKKEASTIINLELDLNLPAPSDEESVSLPHPPPPPPVVLGLGPYENGKKRLMLTASAALVDCHY